MCIRDRPWIDHQFSQALPGDGVFSRYLKPIFLRWTLDKIGILFGQKVLRTWKHKCECVDLKLGAVAGRPLYVCTRSKEDGQICGKLAAMSPLMKQRQKHRHFVCKDCACKDPGKHQALPVLRLVRLYSQVRMDDRCLAMRSAPMRILVHAPRDDTVWGIGHQAPDELRDIDPASPKATRILGGLAFTYNDTESHKIWKYAAHFQDLGGLQLNDSD